MTTAVLLILTYHTWSSIKLPPHLVTPENMLFIVIAPRSKAHTHLYGQVRSFSQSPLSASVLFISFHPFDSRPQSYV